MRHTCAITTAMQNVRRADLLCLVHRQACSAAPPGLRRVDPEGVLHPDSHQRPGERVKHECHPRRWSKLTRTTRIWISYAKKESTSQDAKVARQAEHNAAITRLIEEIADASQQAEEKRSKLKAASRTREEIYAAVRANVETFTTAVMEAAATWRWRPPSNNCVSILLSGHRK